MEAEFSERLKRYRKEKNMTQQELADALGVSNKSISRWESSGGYPDVPLLVPLARALGVSVDDLLDGEKPVRALTRTDVQSLLSFAFALGGGILFYLLRLFVPLLVCYLAYLGCMAYGVYLQRYYAYHSRWFWLGNAGMNLAVNLSVIAGAAAGGLVLIAGGGSTLLSTWFQLWLSGRQRGMVLGVLFLWLALGAALTALTMGLARRHFQEKGGFRLSVWSLPRGRHSSRRRDSWWCWDSGAPTAWTSFPSGATGIRVGSLPDCWSCWSSGICGSSGGTGGAWFRPS